ncbi:MAG: hypothetical protein JJU16_10110 [Alkalibacterium sp.]|nr:hypothetical protein [Alkalibacterium sp.]
MIEINFFERKEKNVLPHLMVLFFFVGIMAISIYFFMMHGLYTRQDASNHQMMQQRSEEVASSRELEQINRTTTQNSDAITALENDQYPIVFLAEDIARIIPEDEAVVVSFQLTETNEVLLQMDNTMIDDHSDLIAHFEQVSYITRVHLNRLEQQPEDDGQFIIDLTLDIDEGLLREGAAE